MPEVGTKRKRPNGAKKTVRFQNNKNKNKNNKSRKYNNTPAFVHGNFSNQALYGTFPIGWQTQIEKAAAYASLENRPRLLRQGYSVNFRPVISELTKHMNSKIYDPSERNAHHQITNNTILRNAQAVTNRVYKKSTPNQIAQAQAQLKPLPVLFELKNK
jgi:hypothetical protein